MKNLLWLFLGALACAVSAPAQVPGALMPPIVSCFYNANGAPYSGGFVYAYQAFTNTPQDTYADSTLGIANTNPVTLDSAGCAAIWLGGSPYDIELRDSSNATVRRTNNVSDPAQILYSKVVLLNPVAAALQTIIGPLGASWFVGTTLKTTSPGVRVSLLDPITTLDTATNTPTVTTTNPAIAGQNYQIPDPGVPSSHFVLSNGSTNTLDCTQAPLTCIRRAFFYFEGAGCNNTTSALGWDTFGNNSPITTCITGTNIQKGILAFGGAITKLQENQGTAAAATTVTVTYPAATGTGDLLIAHVMVDTSRTITGCTDGTNAYTQALHVANGTVALDFWYFNGSAATKTAGTTLTCTLSAAGNAAISWFEYSGNSVTPGAIIAGSATNTGTGTAVFTGTTAPIDGEALLLPAYGSTASGSPTAVGNGPYAVHTVSRQSTNVQTQSQGTLLIHNGFAIGQGGGFTLSGSQTWAAGIVAIAPLTTTPVDITAQRTILLPPTFTTTGTDFLAVLNIQFPTPTAVGLPGQAHFGVSAVCTAPGSTDDPAFNATANVFTLSSSSSSNLVTNNSPAAGTFSSAGCAAGSLLHLRIHRIRTSTYDNYENFVYLNGASLQFAINQ